MKQITPGLKYKLKKYDLTVELYNAMIDKTNNHCYICNRPPATKALHVDHDHRMAKKLKKQGKPITDSIRGLLCMSCNSRLIGRLGDREDSVELFSAAALYLRKHKRSKETE